MTAQPPHRSSSKRAKGFRIGKHKPGLPQSVYLGKAEKIKKTLIHKAKLKRQRAKELAKAGYDLSTDSTTNNTRDERNENQDDHQSLHSESHQPESNPRRSSRDSSRAKSLKNRPQQSPHQQQSKQHEPPPSKKTTSPHQNQTGFISIKQREEPKETPTNQPSTDRNLRPSHSQLYHSNGQPKLSQRVSKILNKLNRQHDPHPSSSR